MDTISAIFICLTLFVFLMGFYTHKESKEFKTWYAELLKQAPSYGFTQEMIDDFERGVFWQYYSADMSPEEGLKEYLSEN